MVTEQGWQQIGPSGRFYVIELPMTDEARELNGGPRRIFYGEFDTHREPEAWKQYLYDPLRVLIAEGVIPRPIPDNLTHFEVSIIKLEGEPPKEKENPLEERERATLEALRKTELTAGERDAIHVSTTVVNHEIGLNPRIGFTYG